MGTIHTNFLYFGIAKSYGIVSVGFVGVKDDEFNLLVPCIPVIAAVGDGRARSAGSRIGESAVGRPCHAGVS